MTPARVALIACSNGYGHVRRMMALSAALSARGAAPVLFAPRRSVERLAAAAGVNVPEMVDFDSGTTAAAWLDGSAGGWTNRLPALDGFDRVVSDNMVEILAIRPDAWLAGSFLWHRALAGFPSALARQADALLERHCPPMLANELFAADYLRGVTRMHAVSLFRLGAPPPVYEAQTDALIACGRGGGADEAARALAASIAAGPSPPFATVWVEPGLLEAGMPAWMRPADFSPAMYARLSVAVIRPGVGTVSDALLAGTRIFAFYEDGNHEMADNAARLARAGVGLDCRDPFSAWEKALACVGDGEGMARHRNAVGMLEANGAEKSADIILAGFREKRLSSFRPQRWVGNRG